MSVNPWRSRRQLDTVIRVLAIVCIVSLIASAIYMVSLPEGYFSQMQVDQ